METKRAKVVLLPTNNKSNILFNDVLKKHYFKLIKSRATSVNVQPYNMYIITNDEIKEGDWIYDSSKEGTVYQYNNNLLEELLKHKNFDIHKKFCWKKIIATTDITILPKVGKTYTVGEMIPQPSKAFIEAYCKSGGIDEVLVEYEEEDTTIVENYRKLTKQEAWSKYLAANKRFKLKVDSHNTITIHAIKPDFTLEEIRIKINTTYNTLMEEVANDYEYNGCSNLLERLLNEFKE